MLADTDVLSILNGWLATYGLWFFLVVPAVENTLLIGFFVPGLVVIMFAGFCVAEGLVSLREVIPLMILGVWIGDSVSYALGHYFWGVVLRRGRMGRLIEAMRPVIESRSRVFFALYHFEPNARLVGAAAAGAFHVPFRRWFPFDFSGAAIWIAFYFSIGYGIGRFGQVLVQTSPFRQILDRVCTLVSCQNGTTLVGTAFVANPLWIRVGIGLIWTLWLVMTARAALKFARVHGNSPSTSPLQAPVDK